MIVILGYTFPFNYQLVCSSETDRELFDDSGVANRMVTCV